ncbi:MAG: hypothetical protein PHI98_15760 [Eubacteriales bacterium]|nr:hypothetical protein [Eubacteriales bacterium]
MMKNNRFRNDADLLLGSLTWTQADQNRVLSELRGEPPKMKRKMSLVLVLAMVLVLLATVALAAGLIFSPKYDAVRLANAALKLQYGITPEMMTVFYREDAIKDADGNDVLVYRSVESQWAEQIGVYTVTAQGQNAKAAWSHDGETISDGLTSPVWGSSQIRLILSDYAAACEAVLKDGAPMTTPDPAEIAKNQQRRLEEAAMAKKAATLTLEEARKLALEAITQEYALTDAQRAELKTTDDESDYYYRMENGEPVIEICYRPDADGQYWVTINAQTGVIEDVLYDSGLAGNG